MPAHTNCNGRQALPDLLTNGSVSNGVHIPRGQAQQYGYEEI